MKCARIQESWLYKRLLTRTNGYTLQILINEYQVAFSPEADMWHFGMKSFSLQGLDTSQSELCHYIPSNPDVHNANAQQSLRTVTISLHILLFVLDWF